MLLNNFHNYIHNPIWSGYNTVFIISHVYSQIDMLEQILYANKFTDTDVCISCGEFFQLQSPPFTVEEVYTWLFYHPNVLLLKGDAEYALQTALEDINTSLIQDSKIKGELYALLSYLSIIVKIKDMVYCASTSEKLTDLFIYQVLFQQKKKEQDFEVKNFNFDDIIIYRGIHHNKHQQGTLSYIILYK